MIFEPIFDGDEIVNARGLDKEAEGILHMQSNDVAKGIAAANAALRDRRVTRQQLEDLVHANTDYPLFSKYILNEAIKDPTKKRPVP